jgi:hypothetical protein
MTPKQFKIQTILSSLTLVFVVGIFVVILLTLLGLQPTVCYFDHEGDRDEPSYMDTVHSDRI